MRSFRHVITALVFCVLWTSVSASAQGWMADRSRREGPGFRVGNLELHPGLGIEGGYDSNVFYEDQDPRSSFLLRLTGHIDVSTLNQQRREEGEAEDSPNESARKLDFRAGLAASYYHFFVDEARDNVSLDAYANATINPEGRFSVYLHDEFSRTVRPFIDRPSREVSGSEVPTYARDRNVVGAELRLQSNGGVLKGALGYDYTLDYFEDDLFNYVNSHMHTMRLNLAWRFLPQTSLISMTEVNRQQYYQEDDEPSSALDDHWRVSSKIGVNGALTRTVGFTALVGYAAGFYDIADEFDNVIVSAALSWRPRPSMKYSVGYDRNFTQSFIGNYAKRDHIYVAGQVMLGGSFLLGIDLSLAFVETGIAYAADGVTLLDSSNAERNDIFVTASLYGEYRFTNWLALTASVGYYGDFTDFEYDAPPTSGSAFPDPGGGYKKFEAWLGLRAFY